MKKEKKHKNRFSRHHIKNKINGGDKNPENMLRLLNEKHHLLHVIFGNLDFYDIIILLIRVSRAKHYERINPKMRELYFLSETKKRRVK